MHFSTRNCALKIACGITLIKTIHQKCNQMLEYIYIAVEKTELILFNSLNGSEQYVIYIT